MPMVNRGRGLSATERARLGPRLTCALHLLVFMQVQKWPESAHSAGRREVRDRGVCMRIYAVSPCIDHCEGAVTRFFNAPVRNSPYDVQGDRSYLFRLRIRTLVQPYMHPTDQP